MMASKARTIYQGGLLHFCQCRIQCLFYLGYPPRVSRTFQEIPAHLFDC